MQKNEIKKQLEKVLKNLEFEEDKIRNLVSDLEADEAKDEEKKPVETKYRTSCISLLDKKGKCLTEF